MYARDVLLKSQEGFREVSEDNGNITTVNGGISDIRQVLIEYRNIPGSRILMG